MRVMECRMSCCYCRWVDGWRTHIKSLWSVGFSVNTMSVIYFWSYVCWYDVMSVLGVHILSYIDYRLKAPEWNWSLLMVNYPNRSYVCLPTSWPRSSLLFTQLCNYQLICWKFHWHPDVLVICSSALECERWSSNTTYNCVGVWIHMIKCWGLTECSAHPALKVDRT